MTRFRRLAIALLAAVTVTVGSLGIVPTVSAMPRSCDRIQTLVNVYWAAGLAFFSVGDYSTAYYWFGRSDQLAAGGCVG